jgi:general secretion pathway protein D
VDKRFLKRIACVSAVAVVAIVPILPPSRVLAAAPAAEKADHAEEYAFAFHDADVSQVAEEILGSTLGLTYTVDPGVTGKISFRIDRKLTRTQLLEAFEAALAANDVVMVRQGDTIALMPRAKAKGATGLRTASERGGRAGYQVVAVPLSWALPSEVAKALEAVGSSGVVVYQSDKQGLLMLGGDGREIDAALQTVKVFDHSGLEGTHIRWFELEKAPAMTVAGDLEKVMQTSGVSGVSIIPLKRLNGIFVLGHTPEAIEATGEWIRRLDEPSKDQGSTLWVYHPRNVAAESLGQTLNGAVAGRAAIPTTGMAMGGAGPSLPGMQGGGFAGAPVAAPQPQPPPPPSAAGMGSNGSQTFFSSEDDPVRISVDRDSNTLLISASPAKWLQIQKILAEIDRPPRQILIEASILEVTLNDSFAFGVDFSVMGANSKLSVVSSGNSNGGVTPSFPGLGVSYIDKTIAAAISALKAKTNVEVVSAPKIMTLDNHAAHLQVGDQVPVVTQSAQQTTSPNAPIVVSTDYRSTGVLLSVTPRITGDDNIVLDVTQEVSAAATTSSSGIDSPTISQRHMESSLILHDGGTVALGGLITSTRTKGSTGVPWLKDIPMAGKLFTNDTKSLSRTELIVLLSAAIIRDQASSDRVLDNLIADMHDIQTRDLIKTYMHK